MRGVILEGDEPCEHDSALGALIDSFKIAPGLFLHEDPERVDAATHHVAQRWAEAEVMNHPKTYKQPSRGGAALAVLDFMPTPLEILDGF